MSNADTPALGEEKDGRGDAERVPRHSVMLSAVVEYFGGASGTKHRVRDLSAGGVRIDAAGGLRRGSTVLITVGALQSVAATVAWVRDDCAGLKFFETVDPEAARAKAVIASRRPERADAPAFIAPSAGWISDLNNPYRSR